MSEVIHADVFIFIVAVAAIVVALLCVVALGWMIAILRDIREVTRTARDASRVVRRMRFWRKRKGEDSD